MTIRRKSSKFEEVEDEEQEEEVDEEKCGCGTC